MKNYQHILVATALKESSNTVAQRAVLLAKMWDIQLSVIYVMDSISPYALGQVGMTEIEDQLHAETKQEVKAFLQDIDFPQANIIVKSGITDKLIVEVAQKVGADLIMVGDRDRTGLSQLFSSSTAENILGNAQCDVLVVRCDEDETDENSSAA